MKTNLQPNIQVRVQHHLSPAGENIRTQLEQTQYTSRIRCYTGVATAVEYHRMFVCGRIGFARPTRGFIYFRIAKA